MTNADRIRQMTDEELAKMPELIDRHALKNHLYRAQAEVFKRSEWYVAGAIQSFIDILDKQPTIEPEVRHGRWDDSADGITPFCTVCGRTHRCFNRTPNFCPNCGAKMEEGDDK